MLSSPREVIRCLITYTDWYQPPSGSFLKVGGARLDKTIGDGLHPGVLETIEERAELCRRVARLSESDRRLLFLTYLRQLHVDDVARALNISRRQCYRRRSSAVQRLAAMCPANQTS